MRKKLSLLLVSMILLTTGCSKEETAEGYVSADSIEESARADFEALKTSADYKNIDFSNASLLLSDDIEDICKIQVEYPDTPMFSNEEFLDFFNNAVEDLFSDSESFENKDNYRFNCEGDIRNEKGIFAGLYDYDYLEKIKSGEFELIFLAFDTGWDRGTNNDGKLLECPTNGSYIKMNRGTLLSKVERTISNAGWFPTDNFRTTKGFSLPESMKVRLEDKEISLDDAAVLCEKYLNEASYIYGNGLKTYSGRILKINDDTEGILFHITNSYNGIDFDSIHFEGGATNFSDGNEYRFSSSIALMARSDEMEFCFLNGLNDKITPIGEKAKSIVSLKRAADIVSRKLTFAVDFKAYNVSLVYCVKQGEKGSPDTAEAHWKFELFDPTDNWTYAAYVNVRDGSFFYFGHV